MMIYTYFEIREASDIRNVNKGAECVSSDHSVQCSGHPS